MTSYLIVLANIRKRKGSEIFNKHKTEKCVFQIYKSYKVWFIFLTVHMGFQDAPKQEYKM